MSATDMRDAGGGGETGLVIFYGALRSGTTLLRLMLDGHPRIFCPGERDFFLDFLTGSGSELRLDRTALAANRIFQSSGLSLPDTTDGRPALAAMLAEDRAQSDKPVYVMILHRGIAEAARYFPEARIVHLLRDPRDVARSSIGMGWAGNSYFGIDHWLATEREWAGLPRGELDLFDLRYETLLEDPEGELGALCAFLGLSFDPGMLRYPEHSTYGPIDPKLAYQWKTRQPAREISELEHKIGDLLQMSGYAPSAQGPKAPGPVRKLQLRVENKRGVLRERFRRYGYADPLWMSLTRRLGLPGLSRGAAERVTEKAKAYLK